MKISTRIFLLSVASILLLCFCSKNDPEPTGQASIKGIVTASGLIDRGQVKIISSHTNLTLNFGSNGIFTFTSLPKGDYKLQVGATVDDQGRTFNAGAEVNVQVNRIDEAVIAKITISELFSQGGGGGGSCPYIYALQNEKKIFCGDVFAGALYKNIERDDYLSLPAPVQGQSTYSLLMTNELEELHHTDLAQIIAINHPANIEVMLDKAGQIQTIAQLNPCRWALSDAGIDYAPYLLKQDNKSFDFNEEISQLGFPEKMLDNFGEENGRNSITVSFDCPEDAVNAKFVISAKNSLWFTKTWEDFFYLFGDYFGDWNEGQKKQSREELNAWSKDEAVPLLVYIETDNGWEYLDHFDLVGSMKFRKMVMPVNLKNLHGKKNVRLKLECAFNFWQLDYAGIDYSTNMNCTTLSYSAINDLNEKNITLLKSSDGKYMEHKSGDEQLLVFESGKIPQSSKQSWFLHSKGYYEPDIKNSNSPQYMKLFGFLFTGAMGEYSLQNFKEYREKKSLVAVVD